ncbi:uncharacterized protein BYT42DRAFT_235097 [Radiomyces spectabilis]|uniref:uncharacterized protein n=1 Tax=Radiomyces spectabilis TaxID=64574 RepID=UPI00221E45C5|nr:uncharacterized protein BYT42DRAFT_235097 [Radiomyces spectabilis]KAI8388441.1 hypothetical protein BYT42DRAFT_235097 [Radiomyces spectabilis]
MQMIFRAEIEVVSRHIAVLVCMITNTKIETSICCIQYSYILCWVVVGAILSEQSSAFPIAASFTIRTILELSNELSMYLSEVAMQSLDNGYRSNVTSGKRKPLIFCKWICGHRYLKASFNQNWKPRWSDISELVTAAANFVVGHFRLAKAYRYCFQHNYPTVVPHLCQYVGYYCTVQLVSGIYGARIG